MLSYQQLQKAVLLLSNPNCPAGFRDPGEQDTLARFICSFLCSRGPGREVTALRQHEPFTLVFLQESDLPAVLECTEQCGNSHSCQ